MKTAFRSKRGFTLVELMIVVVIMAILVTVAVPLYNAVLGGVEKRTCRSNMKVVENMLQNYRNGSFDSGGNQENTVVLNGLTISPTGADGLPVYAGSADAALIGSFINRSIQKPEDICCNKNGVITVTETLLDGAPSVQLECSIHGKVSDD